MLRPIGEPLYRGLVVRRNAVDLSDWLDRAQRMYAAFGGTFVGSPPVIRFPSGARIRSGHLKDDSAYTRYLGHEYQRMLVEELTTIPTERQYLSLLGSCRSTVPGLPARLFSTTNPGNAGHAWVRSRFVDGAPWGTYFAGTDGRKRLFVPAKVEDCPQLADNDPDYVRSLDALEHEDPDLWRAWRLGDWDVFAGMYFKTWRRATHVCEPFAIPEHWDRWLAVDYGYADPWCVLWAARTPDHARLYIYREAYQAGLHDEQQARTIRALTAERLNLYVGDPSMFNARSEQGKPSIASVYQANGVPLTRAQNARIAGWQSVQRALAVTPPLAQPRLQVFSTCTNLIRTLPLMQHDPLNPEDVADKLNSVKTEDHAPDTLRYLLMAEAVPDQEIEQYTSSRR